MKHFEVQNINPYTGKHPYTSTLILLKNISSLLQPLNYQTSISLSFSTYMRREPLH